MEPCTGLAAEMVYAALDADVPAAWTTADEVYGANTAFRTGLRERGVGYVLAVAVDQHVTIGAGRGRVDVLAAALPQRSWQQHCAGQGSKGPRDYDWAWVSINTATPWDEDDRWLLIRRHRRTGELAFYLCWALSPVPLNRLVRVAGTRWAVEESFRLRRARSGSITTRSAAGPAGTATPCWPCSRSPSSPSWSPTRPTPLPDRATAAAVSYCT